jgi:comEA protein
MKFLEKLSKKIGFTNTETNVILFIIITCLLGLVVNYIKQIKNNNAYLEFDYKKEDSLFFTAAEDNRPADTLITQVQKKIDSQSESLDFTKENLPKTKVKPKFDGKIVNINSAPISILATLPGLGQKTANAIVEYRINNGKIKSIDELLNIKGIGKTKLNKIKNFISLE